MKLNNKVNFILAELTEARVITPFIEKAETTSLIKESSCFNIRNRTKKNKRIAYSIEQLINGR